MIDWYNYVVLVFQITTSNWDEVEPNLEIYFKFFSCLIIKSDIDLSWVHTAMHSSRKQLRTPV